MSLQRTDYDYAFPEELIATHPNDKRDASRLLVLDRQTKTQSHKTFSDIVDHFSAGDVLVLNNSKVFPCRLMTERPTGGKQEIFLLRDVKTFKGQKLNGAVWEVLLGPNKKVKKGDTFAFENLTITILNDPDDSKRLALLKSDGPLFEVLQDVAKIPLPPYIKREPEEEDLNRYQTVFAKETGSVAAPTAGLHFTPEIFKKLKNKGVKILYVTLHVGAGTFLPVKTDSILDHKMHEEFFTIDQHVWQDIQNAKKNGQKITAVGTTTVRVLETLACRDFVADVNEMLSTDIFIHPPFDFQIVDHLITNFHQPESTLLMLVSAFADREFILSSYEEAIKQKYRLFSYGDAMLIK